MIFNKTLQIKKTIMNLQRVTWLQHICNRYLRKTVFNNCIRQNRRSIYNFIDNFKVIPQICHYYTAVSRINSYSTSILSEELVDSNVFEKVCEETLESLTEFFEEIVESKETLKNGDVTYSDGVLTVNLGKKLGTYVINRQSPNRQIWLSSPISGPKRYDYVVNGKYWIYKHDSVPLHNLLQNEISSILGEKIDLSKCLYSKV